MRDQLHALRSLASARDPVGRGPCLLSNASDMVEADLAITIIQDGHIPLDATALCAVLTHLAQNAAAHEAKTLTLLVTPSGFAAHDDGSGIASGNRSRIFEPFFTTRREIGGTGMGLAIVKTMLTAAGGEIALSDAPSGTRFDISFS